MKKLLALALFVAMLTFSACNGASGTTEPAGAESNDGQAAQTEAESDGGQTLTMATNAAFPPYEYYENDKIVGVDAEIAEALAEKLGKTLVIEDMEFGSIIAAVQSGKADVGLAGMTVTEDRLKTVDFSTSYATGIQVVIVKGDSEISTIDDLLGKTIGVQQDTTGDIYASDTEENGGFGEDNVERYNKGAEAVMALQQGKVDAVIIDNEPAKVFVAQNEGLRLLDTEYVTEDYAICIAKDSPMLADINKALEEMIADGTVKAILDKYISAE